MGSHRTHKPFEPRGGWRPDVYADDGPPGRRPWDSTDWAYDLVHGDWRRGLVAVRRLKDLIYQYETQHIRAAVAAGVRWDDIARHLGIRRQTLRQKWERRQRRAEWERLGYPQAMSLDDLYREVILDHYRNPRNKRHAEGTDIDVHRNNPLCGDDITVRVAMKDGVAQDVSFEGQGCSISQASASMLTEQILGKQLPEIEELVLKFRALMAGDEEVSDEELGDLVALKGVRKYPVRIKCAVLAWDALQEGVSGHSS